MLHKPVLLQEILNQIQQPTQTPWGLDVTFGRGGHTRAILETFPEMKVLATDRDREAIEFGAQEFKPWIEAGRLKLLQHDFHQPPPTAPEGSGYAFILADLGVSSPQLDEARRGFSFYHDGPLDMRMDQSHGSTAADILAQWSGPDLIELFRTYGEISRPGRVVERILEARKAKPFTSTLELANLIEKAEGWARKGHHPATRYFLALRLVVNEELSELRRAIESMMSLLARRGRLMIISFHSLEDRIIKYAFKENLALGSLVNKKVIVPSREEERGNPRARSAKLRVFERH
jgi:16S rRNA (cytosine1402-N4)-methyltransferase